MVYPGMRHALLFVVSWALASLAAAQPVEVEFAGAGGLQLRGTLLLPEPAPDAAATRVPAMLLLPGSGPTDRDGNQPPYFVTDLLKQVAERIAAEGIATLRFDKRAAAGYREVWPPDLKDLDAFFTFENFSADAAAAHAFLRGHERIDAARVGILGHSEGGLIALHVAQGLAGRDGAPAALILAATAGRTLDELVREQIGAALQQQTNDEAVRKQHVDALEKAIAAVRAKEELPSDLPVGLRPLFNPTVMSLMHSYFTIDPAELAKSFRGPVLIVQGSDDAQVSAERDAPRLEAALKSRESGSCELVVVPGASHNFKTAEGAMPGVTGPVIPAVLDRIASWTREHLLAP